MENDILDASEIDALLNEAPTDGEGNALTVVEPAVVEDKVADQAPSAPVKFELPPELLAQGGALAALAQQYLGDNANALKAITDRLAAPPAKTETAEEQKARSEAALAEFFKDPEAAISKLSKPAAQGQLDLATIQGPAFQAMGEKRVDDFLREMKENDELGLDPKVVKAIEAEFREFADKSSKKSGQPFERFIGSVPRDEARETLENIYMRALGKKIAADTKAERGTQKSLSVAGRGTGGGSSVAGISADKMMLAKATAAGLATGDDGKVDAAEYAAYLKLALGR